MEARNLIFLLLIVMCYTCKNETVQSFAIADVPVSHDTLQQVKVLWDKSEKKISHEVYFAEYGRIRRINGDTLGLVYHYGSKHNEWDNIGMRKSTDNGRTWGPLRTLVPDMQPKRYNGFSTPELLVLKNKWLLLAFSCRGIPDDSLHNNLQLIVSKDSGKTWSSSQVIAYGRSWEPGMVQLPSGEVQLFFANELMGSKNAKGRHEQKILMCRSTNNGKDWSRPKLVAFTEKVRDGMPVPILLHNNKGIVFMVEAVENKQSPEIIWSSLRANWNYKHIANTTNGRRWYGAVAPIWGGAPSMVQLKSGATLIAMQTEGGRKIDRYKNWKKNTIVVMVGNDIAQNFNSPSWPYPNLPINEGYYFSSLFLKDEQTLALVSTYNYPDGHSELRYKEGKLILVPEQKANGH
jgi:hypothetical protein